MKIRIKARTVTAVALFASILLVGAGTAAVANEPDETAPTATSYVTLTDAQTGEVIYSHSETVTLSESGPTTIVSQEIPSIQPFSTVGGSVKPGGVQSSITLTYTKVGEKIRLENVAGSWTPDFSISVKDRKVRIVNGGTLPATIDKYPTSNSYSYATGWGLTYYTNSTNYVPRAMSEIQSRISGTNGQWVKLTHWVDLTGV